MNEPLVEYLLDTLDTNQNLLYNDEFCASLATLLIQRGVTSPILSALANSDRVSASIYLEVFQCDGTGFSLIDNG